MDNSRAYQSWMGLVLDRERIIKAFVDEHEDIKDTEGDEKELKNVRKRIRRPVTNAILEEEAAV